MGKRNSTLSAELASSHSRLSKRERERLRQCTEFCTQEGPITEDRDQSESRAIPIDDKICHLLDLKKQGVHFNLKMSEKAQFSRPGYAYSEALRLGLADECESFIEKQSS